MDQALRRAAKRGDISAIDSLLIQEPDALEKATLRPSADTLLHVATEAGKTLFVKKILELKPGLAWGRNRDGLTPLHIASALGHDEIVDALLDAGSEDLCWITDNEKRVSLHYAAMNGKVQVIEKLLRCCPESLEARTARKETCLHLAVINKQMEALEKLLEGVGNDRALLVATNERGNSIYKLARFTNQSKVLYSLTEKWDTSFALLRSLIHRLSLPSQNYPELMLVVASFLVTLTFQAVTNPPPSIWKQGQKSICIKGDTVNCPSGAYYYFMTFNSAAFVCSILFILLCRRIGGFPFLIYASLIFLTMSYMFLVHAMGGNFIFVTFMIVSIIILIQHLLKMRKTYAKIKINRRSIIAAPTRSNVSQGTSPMQV